MMNQMYINCNEYFQTYCESINKALKSVQEQSYKDAYDVIKHTGTIGARIFVCGNGGSASIAEHFSCDHSKGVRMDTPLLRPNVVSLASNMATITAIGNDVGYDKIFSKQLEFSNATQDDILIVISSSGNSSNIIRALEQAQQSNLFTVALVGFDGGQAGKMASATVHVNSSNYGIVEDCHQIIMHSWAQALRVSAVSI
jgi:D-sedoheptulose 7-phosphate isomerase/D-glycero-D-manno-heptose 1,7-bisphosphate phosphatase